MKFYDREKETAELLRIRQLTIDDSSRMTLVTGRRRIGKTTLIQRAYADTTMVYLYVKNCENYLSFKAILADLAVITIVGSDRYIHSQRHNTIYGFAASAIGI